MFLANADQVTESNRGSANLLKTNLQSFATGSISLRKAICVLKTNVGRFSLGTTTPFKAVEARRPFIASSFELQTPSHLSR
jgi:hypothetical protein